MLIRKLFRTARQYKAQFLSMIIMVAIGVGIFIAFNMEWRSLQKDTGDFLAETNYADYRIYNTDGFSPEDIAAVKDIEGVTAATRVLNVNVDVKDESKSLALFVTEEYTVSTMHVVSGEKYDETGDGFWLSDKYAAANGIKLGQTLTVVYRNVEMSGKVAGLVKSGEFMVCIADSTQIMPDYSTFGFVYASPQKIKTELFYGFDFYPQINVLSSAKKAQFEEAVNKALGKTTLVLSKAEHVSFNAAKGEIEEGQTMAAVLPVLFLLIGVLTMITTMHRITVNEKTQIGTLKALGFKNDRIIRHYTAYGLFIGIVGAALGIGIGYAICAVIINPNMMQGTYFDMPVWALHAPWWTWLILVGVIAFLTLISFLSVKNMLGGTAADALRPYVPKKVKPLLIERAKVWNKLPFGTKWNLRDAFRHKTRSVMTLIGVMGCTILLVGGLGLHDTMTGFLDTLDTKILTYRTRVNIAETATLEQSLAFAEEYGGDWVGATSVQLNGDPVSMEVYGITHGLIKFTDVKNKNLTLGDDGVYICMRLRNKGINVGDTITLSPYGSGESYEVKVAGVLRSYQTESVAMTVKYAQSLNIPYSISSVFLDVSAEDIAANEIISGTQTKSAVMDSYSEFMTVINTMVLVLVIGAVILGVVVLYNLGLMSYVERYRSLATLKVLGFKNSRIGRILIGQNLWLTALGIIIGVPSGVGILQFLILLLGAEYELKMTLGALTFCVSILVTLGVSLLVGVFVALKNRKINMVEALKGAE